MEQQVWIDITDTERVVRYYGMLADKLRRRHQMVTVILALSASGAAVPLIARLPEWIAACMFLVVAGIAIWSFLADYSAKATAAGLFCDQYRHLSAEWRRLWYEGATQAEIDALWEQYNRIASGYDLPVDHALNEKAQYEAYAVIADDFSPDKEGRGASATTAGAS